MTLPQLLTSEQIRSLSDRDLRRWYNRLREIRCDAQHLESKYENPRQFRWCFHEARRELRDRGLSGVPESEIPVEHTNHRPRYRRHWAT